MGKWTTAEKVLMHVNHIARFLEGNRVPAPLCLEVDPTNACNLKCTWCVSQGLPPAQLEFKVFKRAVNEARWDFNVKALTFTGGGEPLLHPDFPRMALHAAEHMKLGLITNGVLLDGPFASEQLHRCFKFIRISLDAATEGTYIKVKGANYFHKVLENVRELVPRKRNTTVGLSFVVCEENRHEARDAQDLARDLGVDYIQFKPALHMVNFCVDTLPDTRSTFTPRYRPSQLACKLAGLVGIIGADGHMYFCCQHRGEAAFDLGDLRTTSLSTCLLRQWRRNGSVDTQTCPRCRYMNYANAWVELHSPCNAHLLHKDFL